MPLKIISQPDAPSTPGQKHDQPVKEGLSTIGRIGRQAVSKIVGLPGDAINLLESIGVIPSFKGTPLESVQLRPPTTEQVQNYFGKEEIAPQGTLEDIIGTTLGNLPVTLALGGGPVWAKIASDVAGTTAMKGAAALGGTDPLSQLAAGLAGGSGFNRLKNYFTKGGSPESLINVAKEAEQKYWSKADDLGANITQKAPGYRSKLQKLYDEVKDSSALSVEQKNDLAHKIKLYEKDVSKDTINAKKLSERVKEINEVWPQAVGKSKNAYRKYLERIQKEMFTVGDEIGKTHPEWHKNWDDARKVGKALNFQPISLALFDEYPILQKSLKNPLGQLALGLGGGAYAAGALGAGGGAAITRLARKGTQVAGFLQNETVAKLMSRAVQQNLNRQIPELARTYAKIDKLADEYEKENPPQQKKVGKLKIISMPSS